MNKRNIPIVTSVLIVLNVLVFLYMEYIGFEAADSFMEQYGMYWPAVIQDGQWYRIITHMFVHSGGEHILNNMFMLGILGYQIEK